jgi:hypothetical protein
MRFLFCHVWSTMVGQCANRLVRVTVGKGRSFKGWPFVVSGEWQFEDGPDVTVSSAVIVIS